jgi:hypothetical protein
MAFTLITQGTFTQPATAVNQIIPLPSSADYFVTTNLKQMAASNPNVNVRGEWFGGGLTAVNDGLSWIKTTAINITTFATATVPGFTYITSFPAPGPAVTGSAITAATPAVVTMTNTFSNGDYVTLYNTTGMLQISGATFQISSVSGSGFTLLGLPAAGFAAAATNVVARKVSGVMPVEPRFLYVTNITQANPAVVTVSEVCPYVAGMLVEFQIPASFGMVQLNNFNQPQSKPIQILSVGGSTATLTYTFTINVDTTNYTAFAFPASTASPTAALFATVAPAGQITQQNPITGVQTGYNFQYPPFKSGLFIPYMLVPAGAQSPGGAANDVIAWQAYKMETSTIGGNGT